MNKAICILIVLLAGTAIVRGQRADFSGTWILQHRVSTSGKDYVNGMSPKIYITQTADSIIIRKQTVDRNGNDTVYTEAAAVGVTSVLHLSPDSIRTIILQWPANGHRFIEIVQYKSGTSKKTDRKITYTWRLSDDKSLKLERIDETPLTGEMWSMEGIYKKRTL